MMPPLHSRTLSAAALAALLAAPAWAQEAPPAEAPAAEVPAAESPAADETPPAEEPAAAAPEAPADAPADSPAGAAADTPPVPEPEVLEVVRETHGDWEVRCLPDGDECFIYQLALDPEENPVAEFSLVTLPAGGEAVAGVTVVTPLGTLLPAGVVMRVDGGEARGYEFTFCTQVGCFARFGLAAEDVAALKRGRLAEMRLVSISAPEAPVTLEVSLSGFTAAYDSLGVPDAPAAE
jgi:invasion protein IalB